ncbi:MAG: dephospho-CoA kinase, partial [Thermoplasmatota archaeon]
VRSYEEVDIFKAELQEKMQIVAIHASPETRYERLKKRGRDDKPHTWDEFIERDHRELDWGLGKIIALADKIIINEGSLSEFKGKVEEYLDSIAR